MKNAFDCCNGCSKRTVGCHGRCKEYKDAREENIKRVHDIARYKEKEYDFVGYIVNGFDRMNKRNYTKNKASQIRHY